MLLTCTVNTSIHDSRFHLRLRIQCGLDLTHQLGLNFHPVEEKAMFLNEIARLHAMCGDQQKCSRYLSAAVEVLATDKKSMKCPRQEEDLHCAILQGVYVDIG